MTSDQDISVIPEHPPDTPHREESSARRSPKKTRGGIVLERAGSDQNSWERWIFQAGLDASLLDPDTDIPPHSSRIVTLPSSALFAWPLWIAASGENDVLVRLELSGRHLLRKGMEDSLQVLPILEQGDRRLVLALAVEEPFIGSGMPEDWRTAERYEIPARLFDRKSESDLILWREWGLLYMAFYRNAVPVWICSVRKEGLGGLARRFADRLCADGVLNHSPRIITLQGLPEDDARDCIAQLSIAFPGSTVANITAPENCSPTLPRGNLDLPPIEAKLERGRHERHQRTTFVMTVGALLYLIILIWGAGDLLIRQNSLKKIRHEISSLEAPSTEARVEFQRWKTLREAVDPDTYALDLLAAVAAPTANGKVRLTLFSMEKGRLQLSGEATDVTEAYKFIEELKKTPSLQHFDWNTAQPQLAGKNSVKFEMEGTQPDATTGAK